MTLAAVEDALSRILSQTGAKPGLTLANKIVSNILASEDPKYRKVKTSSTALQKLLSLDGGLELLLAVGFEPDSDELILPASASPVALLQVRGHIVARCRWSPHSRGAYTDQLDTSCAQARRAIEGAMQALESLPAHEQQQVRRR